MKILDAPSQFKNVRNTTSQCHRHQLRQKIHHVRQKYIMYAKQNTTYTKHQIHQTKTKFSNKNTKYAKQNTKYAKQNTKYWFTLFCREIIFVANLRTFWRTFYRPKKYGGVPKMTIIRYVRRRRPCWLQQLLWLFSNLLHFCVGWGNLCATLLILVHTS